MFMGDVKTRTEQRLAVTGMNKSELSRALGISTQALNNWFLRDNIPGDKLWEMAELLGCDPRWLNTGEESGDQAPPQAVKEPAASYNTGTELMDLIYDVFEAHFKETGDWWPLKIVVEEAYQMYGNYKDRYPPPTRSQLMKALKIKLHAKNDGQGG